MDGELVKPVAVKQTVMSTFEKASIECYTIEPSVASAFTRVQAKADIEGKEFVGDISPIF